jgi:hypothetical protein
MYEDMEGTAVNRLKHCSAIGSWYDPALIDTKSVYILYIIVCLDLHRKGWRLNNTQVLKVCNVAYVMYGMVCNVMYVTSVTECRSKCVILTNLVVM